MVLTIALNMKEKFKNFLVVSGFFLAMSLLINVIHLIWYIADPEGFWGFAYFIELLRAGLLVVVILLFATFVIIVLFSMIISSFKKGFKEANFLKVFGLLVFLLIFPLGNYLFSNGIYLYITKNLADKYKHLEKTQEYISKGETLKACEYAEKAYKKEMNRTKVSAFFFLSKLYSLSKFDKAQRLTSKYGAIISYAQCLKISNDYHEKAEDLFKSAISISGSKLLQGQNASFLSYPLLSLAELNLQKGEYYKAEEYFEELQKLHDEFGDEDMLYQIEGRILFSDRALRVGDIEKSAKINLENLKLYEKSGLNTDSQYYLGLLLVGALTEMYLSNFDSVKDLLIRAQTIAEENRNKQLYPNFLITKANFLKHSAYNDYDGSELIQRSWWKKINEKFKDEIPLKDQLLQEAERSYKLALDEISLKEGKNSYPYVSVLRGIGDFYYNMGEIGKSRESYNEAVEILRPTKDKARDLYNNILLSSLRTNEVVDHNILKEVEDQIFFQVTSNYLFLTEEEREKFISKTENQLQALNAYYLKEGSPESNIWMYNNILATKQLALNSNHHLRRFLSIAPMDIQTKYNQILKTKEELFNTAHEENYRDLIFQITEEERILKSKIVKETSFTPFQPRSVEWDQISKALGENEVAVELFNLPVRPFLGADVEIHYFALLINNKSHYPKMIPLFKEKELNDFLNESGGIRERVNSIYGSKKEELFNLIWEPLTAELKDSSSVYLSISGILHNISFPALVINQSYELHLLGSTRDILNLKGTIEKKEVKNIALFGDAEFNSIIESESRSFRTLDNRIKEGLESGLFSDLQYTRQEIDSIEKIFKLGPGLVSKWLGKAASENNFRSLDKAQYDIIHLATHGFYFKKNDPLNQGAGIMIKEDLIVDNSMFRSGILLSKDDGHRSSKDNDGILTAFEISNMDLSGVDLMVLSACETARGDISGWEGVFGLQRALKLAGVKEQIVSLWQVPDKQTSELFQIFYKNYSLGNSAHASLEIAQRQMSQKYSPFHWAGFVLLEGN